MNDFSGLLLLILRFGIAIVLYSFLGWSILTMWREFQQLANSTTFQQIPTIYLSVRKNFNQLDQRKFTFPQIFIGRDPSCDLHVSNATVSSKHSRIFFHDNQWWIEDLKSSNGTFLNDQPVTIPTVLTENDTLRCGEEVIHITFSI